MVSKFKQFDIKMTYPFSPKIPTAIIILVIGMVGCNQKQKLVEEIIPESQIDQFGIAIFINGE